MESPSSRNHNYTVITGPEAQCSKASSWPHCRYYERRTSKPNWRGVSGTKVCVQEKWQPHTLKEVVCSAVEEIKEVQTEYKKAKDSNNKTRKGRKTMKFYNQLNDILAHKPPTRPEVFWTLPHPLSLPLWRTTLVCWIVLVDWTALIQVSPATNQKSPPLTNVARATRRAQRVLNRRLDSKILVPQTGYPGEKRCRFAEPLSSDCSEWWQFLSATAT